MPCRPSSAHSACSSETCHRPFLVSTRALLDRVQARSLFLPQHCGTWLAKMYAIRLSCRRRHLPEKSRAGETVEKPRDEHRRGILSHRTWYQPDQIHAESAKIDWPPSVKLHTSLATTEIAVIDLTIGVSLRTAETRTWDPNPIHKRRSLSQGSQPLASTQSRALVVRMYSYTTPRRMSCRQISIGESVLSHAEVGKAYTQSEQLLTISTMIHLVAVVLLRGFIGSSSPSQVTSY